jgi:hypothetical protein
VAVLAFDGRIEGVAAVAGAGALGAAVEGAAAGLAAPVLCDSAGDAVDAVGLGSPLLRAVVAGLCRALAFG